MATPKTLALAASALAMACLSACSGNDTAQTDANGSNTTESATANTGENIIEYMVWLKPQDMRDPDAHELYDNFNREAFVDSVFAAVYQHHAIVTDEDGDTLSLELIKEREVSDPRYAHSKVAGVRFREAWSFDPATKTMTKKVKSMLIGYEFVYDSTIVAIRPAFKISFDN